MPGWRAFASWYWSIIFGVVIAEGVRGQGSRVRKTGALAPESWTLTPLFLAIAKNFAHSDAIAAAAVANLGHIVAHEHEAATARPFEIFDGRGIGYVTGIEARSFVNDAHLEKAGGQPDMHERALF